MKLWIPLTVIVASLIVGLHLMNPFHGGPTQAKSDAPAAFASETSLAAATADEWPSTNAGKMARAWVEGFNGGEPGMKKFLNAWVTEESLAKKPMSERMETYRTSRDKLGRLAFGSVVSSKPSELVAKLVDEDGKTHEFTFKVHDKAPYKMVSVSLKQNAFMGHFGGGFHH
jgi:hypothetical protein